MPANQKEAGIFDEEKKKETEVVLKELQGLLDKQEDDRMKDVKVWLNRINPERGVIYIGMSLGEGLGCSPFCGCAAKQIGEQFEPFLMNRLPWVVRVVTEAEAPTDDGNPLLKFI